MGLCEELQMKKVNLCTSQFINMEFKPSLKDEFVYLNSSLKKEKVENTNQRLLHLEKPIMEELVVVKKILIKNC